MRKMRNYFVVILTVLMIVPFSVNAQEEETKKKKPRPVREMFNSSLLLDRQTVNGPREKGLEFIIHHRFGTMQNGMKDLYGIYAPSNIRLGLDYGITEDLSVGFGTEKNNKLQEFHAKYAILKQTRKNEIPVSLSYYVNVAIDARNSEAFGENYSFANRLSYFHQLIIARKFTDRISILLTPEYSHFNAVDSVMQNDHFGIGIAGKFNAFGNFSIIAEFDQPMPLSMVKYYQEDDFPLANFALGFEIATGTHSFQLFAANYDKITPQKNLAYNQNSLTKGEILVGMNVLVRF